jgi:hypothetical protein
VKEGRCFAVTERMTEKIKMRNAVTFLKVCCKAQFAYLLLLVPSLAYSLTLKSKELCSAGMLHSVKNTSHSNREEHALHNHHHAILECSKFI